MEPLSSVRPSREAILLMVPDKIRGGEEVTNRLLRNHLTGNSFGALYEDPRAMRLYRAIARSP
jgi:hypothetical protein